MRIHEILEITPELYLLEFSQHLTLDELSGYTYRKPAVKPQLRRAMQVARKGTSRFKNTAGKVRRVTNKAINAATVRAQRQQAAQKQKQATQAKQAAQSIQAATPHAPIKYRKQLIRNQYPAQPNPAPQQPKSNPAPASITTKIGGVADLKDLGIQAQMIFPKSERGTPVWNIDNS
jgi:Sec-independent protein translocase protein TatA